MAGEGRDRAQPPRDCPLCPRLVAYRLANRRRHPQWHNAPVPSFGDPAAALLIVGLAPGVAGANRTGRPFTGDYAGEILYPALLRHGLARGSYAARPDDDLEPVDCRITNAVRCVPPENKPTGEEIATCRPFLRDELLVEPRPRIALSLGRIAHDSVLRVFGCRLRDFPFRHGASYRLEDGTWLVSSYHCSRYNMNTGRLTEEMFDAVMKRVVELLGETSGCARLAV